MGLGFRLAEHFSGSYYLHADALRDRAMSLSLDLEVDGIRQFAKDRLVQAHGTVDAEDLSRTTVAGTIGMRLFDQKRVTYDLRFDSYRLRGQRELFLHDALDSLTVLGASLYDAEDAEIGRAMLRFDPRSDLPAMLKSFRPRLRRPLLARGR